MATSQNDVDDLAEWQDVKTIEDVDRIAAEHYPDGIEVARKCDYGNGSGGAYIGFNLCRYAYTEKLAAQIHVARDTFAGKQGHSYGFPFQPRYETIKATDKEAKWFEVWTD
jgi:hypothetical protein